MIVKIEKKEIDQRMQHFETVCRDEGIKLTHQRLEIFREVAQADDHPDAEQVFQRVRDRMPTVSLDTVYRTLWLLNDLGLVVTLGASREPTRFDLTCRVTIILFVGNADSFVTSTVMILMPSGCPI